MRFPSVRSLATGLRLPPAQAAEVRRAMAQLRGLAVYARVCPDASGIESIGLPEGCFARCRNPEVDIWYVNRGDTDATTLMTVNGIYRVGCWGDVAEAYDRRHPRHHP
jgi:hypothetical protein